ncbi:[Pyruvate dehydrogenase (acetyl-transferring)] kinase, mitochondrial [Auxenochlorella protothecoides]|uniref:Protein-serine/threonine kinase n=1 Tax=Auxenochlorella protothecoides TaxID=3075 RepID=A0A087SNE6_AUXPR|nr:[Pyruvate dehydrogenase (acetyl-transferring)] kinase, mitochondrial [Auxenochlorella protothecoides]KFM27250.1 [Pyruvate dehydrogenase (acetyl-transferring)] kinase, mitochondrial [Auxenochlorella protothecoides]
MGHLVWLASNPQTGPRLADHWEKSVVDDVFSSALRKQTGVSLKYMLDFGSRPIERQLILSAQFLHNELPVRLAHRVAELENSPYGLSAKPHVLKVRDWYVESFKELRAFSRIRNASDEEEFTNLLRHIYFRHRNVVPVLAMGVAELKRELQHEVGLNDLPDIHQMLDSFYLSRIGIRMLIGQHVALHEPQKENHIGLIDTRCSPGVVCADAIADARMICMREKGSAPEVSIYGDPGFAFPYVPSHLHHMVFELVKNSLRAVYDRWEDAAQEPPPIRVVVAEGEEDICIKVSDEGGGIARSGQPKIWTYLYTTARSPLEDIRDRSAGSTESAEGPSVLAGYGYGLPISRLYARYFGGDLQMISMENYGTDAYLHLNRLGNVQEPLP